MKKFNIFMIFTVLLMLAAGSVWAQDDTTMDQGMTDEESMQGEMGMEQEMGMDEEMDMEKKMEGMTLDKVDQDGDGNVSWGELQQQAGEMITEDKYNEFDEDGDGVLGSDEFEQAKSFLKEEGGKQKTY